LVNLAPDGESITTTADHPFYNVTDGDFQWASELSAGDQVITDDGRLVTVHGIDPTTAYDALAYNLTVEGIHTPTTWVTNTSWCTTRTSSRGDACSLAAHAAARAGQLQDVLDPIAKRSRTAAVLENSRGYGCARQWWP
jgi:hypothetical protein